MSLEETPRADALAGKEAPAEVGAEPRAAAPEGQTPAPRGPVAQIGRATVVMMVLAVVACVGCDQATKRVAAEVLEGAGTRSYWGDFFRLTYAENTGAFLGLGHDWPQPVRWVIFTLLAVLIVVASLLWAVGYLRQQSRASIHVWAMLLIGAGGVGNLIDRVVREGRVIDFMNMGIGSLRTGIFNVADVQIMVGMGLLLLFWRDTSKPADAS